MKVKDVMMRDVLTVTRATNLRELLGIFKKFHNSPLIPVVNEYNVFLGTVSLEDIIEPFSNIPARLTRSAKYALGSFAEISNLQKIDIPSDAGTLFLVDDLMKGKALTIPQEAEIIEAERMITLNKEAILPVLSGDKFAGMITKFDIVIGILRAKGIL